MAWYQNPILVAVSSAFVGAFLTSIVSIYIWKKTHKVKRVDGIINNISSLLNISHKIKNQLEIKFSGKVAKTAYLFSVDIINSGTEAVTNHPVQIRLDESSTIGDYSIKTEPEIGFGNIIEKKKDGNALDIEIALLNPADKVSIEIVSLDNDSEKINVYMKNANVNVRVYQRRSSEEFLGGSGMLLLAGMNTFPFIGSFVTILMALAMARKMDKIANAAKPHKKEK